jgi:hypothetical protein
MKRAPFAVYLVLLALALLVAASAQANAPRVTQGDAQAVFAAFNNGGWAILLNGGTVEEGAPADFLPPDTMARISPLAAWNGRHFCSLDWHVVGTAAVEGNAAGGTRTNQEIFQTLSQIQFEYTLDGAPLDTMRTAIARMLNPELRGLVEAYSVQEAKVVAPADLSVGQHSLQFTGFRPGRPPMVMPAITFFIDPPGKGACL